MAPTELTLTARALAAIAALLAGTTLAGCPRSGPSATPTESLRARIEASSERDLLDFTYTAAGTSVTSCFRPNREFAGFVDYADGFLVLRRAVEDGSEDIAMMTPDDVVIRSSVVARSVPEPAWLRLPRVVPADARTSVTRALGSDLAYYLLSGELPPTPQETLLAALDVAEDVRAEGRQMIAGSPATGWIIDVDADEYDDALTAEVTGSTAAASSSDQAPVPQFVGWFDDDGDIVRLEVRLDREEGPAAGNDETPGGWVIDYRELEQRPALPDPSPIVELDPRTLAQLEARPIETCELPL